MLCPLTLIHIISHFFVFSEFSLATAGYLCSDASLQPIDDKEQCVKSFQVVQKLYPDALDKVLYQDTWPIRPKGCFLHLLNKYLHWNPHETGNANSQDRQVCKDPTEEKGISINVNNKPKL